MHLLQLIWFSLTLWEDGGLIFEAHPEMLTVYICLYAQKVLGKTFGMLGIKLWLAESALFAARSFQFLNYILFVCFVLLGHTRRSSGASPVSALRNRTWQVRGTI